VSMALSAGPNTGTSQWFVNLVNNAFLDNASSGGPFTVFAQVAGDGMNLYDVYNSGLGLTNLNPDYNDDGVHDSGYPFYTGATDATPYAGNSLFIVQSAKRIDY